MVKLVSIVKDYTVLFSIIIIRISNRAVLFCSIFIVCLIQQCKILLSRNEFTGSMAGLNVCLGGAAMNPASVAANNANNVLNAQNAG